MPHNQSYVSSMQKERFYIKEVGTGHLRKFGQYFTPATVAEFMVNWLLDDNMNVVLDPALGNSIFQRVAQKTYPDVQFVGYEIDKTVLDSFPPLPGTTVRFEDFLTSSWNDKYEGIIGNPPYMKFQLIDNRLEIQKSFEAHSTFKPNGFSNLYILFTLKCIGHLAANGRMAFLIPPDFLDSSSGELLKRILVDEHLLEGIISLDEMGLPMFDGAMTNSCIVLITKAQKSSVRFFAPHSVSELENYNDESLSSGVSVPYKELSVNSKWGVYLFSHEFTTEAKAPKLGSFVDVKRGIATGSNEYFLFNENERINRDLSLQDLSRVVARSADFRGLSFGEDTFHTLVASDRNMYLFTPRIPLNSESRNYVQYGESLGIDQLYLPSRRKPWYSGENRSPAPIWIGQANRGNTRVVRNLAGVRNLTTFHGIYPLENYSKYVDAIFALLLSDIGQENLLRSAKRMATGLIKYQPSDLKNAEFFDIDSDQAIVEVLNQLGKNVALANRLSPEDEVSINLLAEKLYRKSSDSLSNNDTHRAAKVVSTLF